MFIHFSFNQLGSVFVLLFIIIFTLIIPMFEIVSNLEGFEDIDNPPILTLQKLIDLMIKDNYYIEPDKSKKKLSNRINIIKNIYLSDNYELLNTPDKEYISNLLDNYLQTIRSLMELYKNHTETQKEMQNNYIKIEKNRNTIIKQINDKINTILQTTQSLNGNTIIK